MRLFNVTFNDEVIDVNATDLVGGIVNTRENFDSAVEVYIGPVFAVKLSVAGDCILVEAIVTLVVAVENTVAASAADTDVNALFHVFVEFSAPVENSSVLIVVMIDTIDGVNLAVNVDVVIVTVITDEVFNIIFVF